MGCRFLGTHVCVCNLLVIGADCTGLFSLNAKIKDETLCNIQLSSPLVRQRTGREGGGEANY